MKRIAIFPSAFHPSLGGVEELTGQLAIHLRKVGVSSIICTNRWPRSLPSFERWKGFDLHRFPFRLPEGGLKSKLSFRLSAQRILKAVRDTVSAFGADAIHVQCVSSNAWYAWQTARSLRIPLIVSVQGERTMDAQNLYGRSPLQNRILKNVLYSANGITACSRSTLADLSGYHGMPFGERACVIYNGVNPAAYRSRERDENSRPYLLAMGRMVPQKGFAQLLKALAISQAKVGLVLAGDGPELESLKRLSVDLKLQKRVSFCGRADRMGVSNLLSNTSGLVVPSLREPMGIVALEGMAAGKPLLVSAVDGLQEIAPISPWCRHVPPGDVESIARGLEWLECVQNSPGFTPSGPMKWSEQFHWDAIISSYRKTYEEALADFLQKTSRQRAVFSLSSKASEPLPVSD